MIDANDLAQLRADQEAALPDTCTRTRYTYAADGYGGSTASAAAATYACRVRPMPGGMVPREATEAAKMTGAALYVVTLPYTADVAPDDEIAHGGRALQVIGVYRDPSWDTATRVYCQEKR